MTQHIGLIGYPLRHSLSPDFQQAALDSCEFDICYEAWETEAASLPSVVSRLRYPQNLGANITVPYKEAVLCFMDEANNLTDLIGAVNTVVNRDGKLVGYNTDAYGFVHALRDGARFEPEKKRAMILGAGGAARAVSFALLQEKIDYLAIVNRTPARAEGLADSLRKHAVRKGIRTEVIVLLWQDLELREAIKSCQLIVNCTTLGMKYSSGEGQSPLGANLIPKGALVYDLVYNPSETPLLKMAREAGANVIGGLSMLVYQGAVSFKLWTGRDAPIDIMFAAARRALLETGGDR